jgi:hypothetical protein
MLKEIKAQERPGGRPQRSPRRRQFPLDLTVRARCARDPTIGPRTAAASPQHDLRAQANSRSGRGGEGASPRHVAMTWAHDRHDWRCSPKGSGDTTNKFLAK